MKFSSESSAKLLKSDRIVSARNGPLRTDNRSFHHGSEVNDPN